MSEMDKKRNEFAGRLKAYSMMMYQAMSQGGDHTIRVNPEMAEDVLAASAAIEGIKSAPLTHKEIFERQQYPDAKPQ